MPKTGQTRNRLKAWLEPVEDQMSISMELDSTEMLKRFVMAGLGVAFVARSALHEEVAAGKAGCASRWDPSRWCGRLD